jgi:seryl-tRNA synthetase
MRYIAFSPALRREAGAAGKDTRGILRLHQFHKVEMEVFSTPEQGLAEHSLLISIEEELLQKLNLSYQVLLKCTGDIGDPNARGVDINTWMPGQGVYRETHTADYMTDYQARRLNARFKRSTGVTEFVHTNDATALAVGRILAAIIENYQTAAGTVIVPEVLRPWMFGVTEIKRPS